MVALRGSPISARPQADRRFDRTRDRSGLTADVPAWVRDAVFYQIFPDRFASSDRVAKPGPLEAWDAPPTSHGFKGGDLLGIAEHLPYLDDLGVTAIYLTPIFSSASNHRYHTYDYYTVDPLLGGNDALRVLLDAAHERGMRVVLDGVFNHSGRGFWPFHHILETGLDLPYRRWFHIDDATLARQGRLNAYPNPNDHGTQPGYAAWWNLPGLPKLNTDEPQVREYLFGVAEHWLRFGIDGWRLDVPTEIDDEAFWQEFRRRCRAVNPQAYLVGEIWQVAPDWLRGDRFDALMNYPLAEAILGFAAGPDLDLDTVRAHDMYREYLHPLSGVEFAREAHRSQSTYEPAVVEAQLNLLGSHDAPRLRTIVGGGLDRVRMATLLQMTLAGAPCIYYGDEIGMTGGLDPANRGAFTWDEERWEIGLRGSIAELTRLRRAEPAFRNASHPGRRRLGRGGCHRAQRGIVSFRRGRQRGRGTASPWTSRSPMPDRARTAGSRLSR